MGSTMLVSENNRTAPYRFSQLASGRQRLSDFHWARRTDGICPACSRCQFAHCHVRLLVRYRQYLTLPTESSVLVIRIDEVQTATVHRWSGSGLPYDHGRTSVRDCAHAAREARGRSTAA